MHNKTCGPVKMLSGPQINSALLCRFGLQNESLFRKIGRAIMQIAEEESQFKVLIDNSRQMM